MIVAEPSLLSEEWMLIGRQEATGYGARIDLLAIAPDGALVLIEIKRDRTPREVVAQALDYAYWVEGLRTEDVAAIYARFAPGKSLADDFLHRFGQPLDEDSINQSHQIVIVAGFLDESSERIVTYLSDRDIAINVLCFQVFTYGAEQFLSRSWLLDPMATPAVTIRQPGEPNEPWNGEYYCYFGHGESRSWADAVEFGFICAGGGTWYSKTLHLLNPGDRVWVNVPGYGFVGVGRVSGPAQPASTCTVNTSTGEVPVLDAAKRASYHAQSIDNPELCEYFVHVQWLQTVPLEQAVQEIGMFVNGNTVCKPTTPKWRTTVERLKEKFPRFDA
jgi:hypothetical protein